MLECVIEEDMSSPVEAVPQIGLDFTLSISPIHVQLTACVSKWKRTILHISIDSACGVPTACSSLSTSSESFLV